MAIKDSIRIARIIATHRTQQMRKVTVKSRIMRFAGEHGSIARRTRNGPHLTARLTSEENVLFDDGDGTQELAQENRWVKTLFSI